MTIKMTHKRHVSLIALVGFLFLSAAASFNYALDPAHLFGKSQYEARVVSILSTGRNVANISNYDERLMQKYVIENATTKKQVMVLGSSRVMQISSSAFPTQSFYNHGVSGATIEDDISILEMYFQKGLLPETVIIGADPWLLNKNNGQTRWQSLSGEFLAASRRLGLKTNIGSGTGRLFEIRKYKELISLPYLEASYEKWKREAETTDTDYYPTAQAEADVSIKLADGSINYDRKYRNRSVVEVKKLALDYLNDNPVYSLGDFDALDSEYQGAFETFVKDLKNRGIRVILILVPYHPDVYSTFAADQKYRMVLNAERYFAEFGRREMIEVVGSYDPADSLLDEHDFYDAMHPKMSAINQMIRAIKNQRRPN